MNQAALSKQAELSAKYYLKTNSKKGTRSKLRKGNIKNNVW